MANLSPSLTSRIPSAAQRYYAQPRICKMSSSATSPTYRAKVEHKTSDTLAKGRQGVNSQSEQKDNDNSKITPRKQPRTRKRPSYIPATPTRRSPRLIRQHTAALERMLREGLAGNTSPAFIRSCKRSKRRHVELMSNALPSLSEDPASYKSNTEDCRFHLPVTMEDRIAIHAALTPTLFRLKKKGWDGSVVWNPDASYMEAHQKCLQEYYRFELMKKPDLSPFDLPVILTLLPWYGKISDFRNSPNWPKGW